MLLQTGARVRPGPASDSVANVASVLDVVNHCNAYFPALQLNEQQKADLVAFLKSL